MWNQFSFTAEEQLLMLHSQLNKRSEDIDLVFLFQYKQHNQCQMFLQRKLY